jgi:hypothetical protein
VKPKDPEAAQLEALIKSARRGARETLCSRIAIARKARDDAAMSVFLQERQAAGTEARIPPTGRNRVSTAAVKEADAAADIIMKGGIAAGAADAVIVDYAMHDYQRFIHSHMMSSFGHLRGQDGPIVRRQLVNLDHSTNADTQILRHRVKVLREEYEKACPTAYDRIVRALMKNRAVVVLIIVFTVFGAVSAAVQGLPALLKITHLNQPAPTSP